MQRCGHSPSVVQRLVGVATKVGGGLHHSASPEPTHRAQPAAAAGPGQSGASWLASQTELPGGAQHLQYNSPIGLYSKSSAQEAVYAGDTAPSVTHLVLPRHPENPPGRPSARRISP